MPTNTFSEISDDNYTEASQNDELLVKKEEYDRLLKETK